MRPLPAPLRARVESASVALRSIRVSSALAKVFANRGIMQNAGARRRRQHGDDALRMAGGQLIGICSRR